MANSEQDTMFCKTRNKYVEIWSLVAFYTQKMVLRIVVSCVFNSISLLSRIPVGIRKKKYIEMHVTESEWMAAVQKNNMYKNTQSKYIQI